MSNRQQKKHVSAAFYIILLCIFICIVFFGYFRTGKQLSLPAEISAPVKTEAAVTDKRSNFVVLPDRLEIPVCTLPNSSKDYELRNFSAYSLCYRETYEQAEWSAYTLTAERMVKYAERSNDFKPDTLISTGSAALSDYKGSGYDRGHLTPAADMAFSQTAMNETFFMSNISPQHPQFNRGIWKQLEAQIRAWALKSGQLYVISGPVLSKPAEHYTAIGANKVAVPEYYYKAVLMPLYENQDDKASAADAKSVSAIGFIIPNKNCENPFWDYAVPIDTVEEYTKLDFFSLLDDETEIYIEAAFSLHDWK